MTKEMTAGRRVDTLTYALLHHAKHRLEQFGGCIDLQYNEAVNLNPYCTHPTPGICGEYM